MWIYYYIMMGPGHQSQDDGFRYYPYETYEDNMEIIQECL